MKRATIVALVLLSLIFLCVLAAAEPRGKRERTNDKRVPRDKANQRQADSRQANRHADKQPRKAAADPKANKPNRKTHEERQRPATFPKLDLEQLKERAMGKDDAPLRKERAERGVQTAKSQVHEENNGFDERKIDELEQLIKSETVLLFTRSNCLYCDKARNAFESLAIPFTVYDIDEKPDRRGIKRYLQNKTDQKTFPIIFVNGQLLGGFQTLEKKLLSSDPELMALSQAEKLPEVVPAVDPLQVHEVQQ